MSVARCRREVDSREFIEWQAASRRLPFGGDHEDARTGHLLELVYAANKKKNARPLRAEDWFPSLRGGRETPFWETAEGQVTLGRTFALLHGGTVVD